MSKVDDTAEVIYGFLKDNRNTAFTLDVLLKRTGLANNATTRTAIKRMREWAIGDGVFSPDAVPANGFTYAVTDDPNMVFDSIVHQWRVIEGARINNDRHRKFALERQKQMPRGDRKLITIMDRIERNRRESEALVNQMVGLVIESRREKRNG